MATTKTTKTKAAKKAEVTESGSSRRFTPASFRNRRLRRKAEKKIARDKLPNSFKIMGTALKVLRDHWEVFGGVLLVYTIINLILIGGFSSSESLQSVRNNLSGVFTGETSKVTTGFTLFAFLVTSGSGTANGAASAYQTVIIIIFSLAFVWALRQFYAGNNIRVRDAIYNSSYPLVQLMLVLLMVTLHLLPAALASFVFQNLILSELLTVGWHILLASLISVLLLSWSAYLLCHSLIAAYAVTLPEMTPLKALRSAKNIVRYRRGMVLRKLLFLPVALFVLMALIMVPLSAFFTGAATIVYFLLTMISVPVVHAYMYTLYRELIK